MSEDGAEALWKWLKGDPRKDVESTTKNSSLPSTNQPDGIKSTINSSNSRNRMTLGGKGLRDTKQQQDQKGASIKWNHPWAKWNTVESNPVEQPSSQMDHHHHHPIDDSNRTTSSPSSSTFFLKRMILGKQVPSKATTISVEETASLVPVKQPASSLVPERITQVTQQLAVLAKEKSSEMVKLSNDVASKVIQQSTERATTYVEQGTQIASTAMKTSAEVANKYVEQGKTAVTNVVKDSTDIAAKYAQQTKDFGFQKIEDATSTVKKITEVPAHVATNIKLARDDLAMQSFKKAKQTRNFLVGMFIGGCFAFGLGIGLGAGGVRRHLEW